MAKNNQQIIRLAQEQFVAVRQVEMKGVAMQRVLALHEDYPNNKNGLAGKLGKLKPYKTALEMPGMKHRAKRNYEGMRKTTPDIAAQRQTHPVRLAADRWRLKKAEC